MIINLTAEISSIPVPWTPLRIASIERLCLSVYANEVMLTIETPAVIDFLEKNIFNELGNTSRGVLKKARSNYAFQASLFTLPLKKMQVVGTPNNTQKNSLLLDDLLYINFKPYLLAEHLIDAKIYIHAANHYIIEKNLGKFSLSISPTGGGGSSIFGEFENILKRRAFCLTVTDSDENWPNRVKSSVTKRCDAIASKSNDMGESFRLPSREIENIIPISILKDIFQNTEKYDAVIELEKIGKMFPDLWRCGDLKDGVKISHLREKNIGGPEYAFYVDCFKKNGLIAPASINPDEEFSKDKDDKYLIPAIGNCGDLLHAWFEERTAHKALEGFTGHWRNAWLKIGEMVFSWACVNKPQLI